MPDRRQQRVHFVKDTSGLGCEVKYPEQETKGVAEITNEAGGTVLLEWKLEGIAYSWTASCPNAAGKAGSDTNGKLAGSVRFAGKDGGGTARTIKVT